MRAPQSKDRSADAPPLFPRHSRRITVSVALCQSKMRTPVMAHSRRQTRWPDVPDGISPPKEHVADVPTRFAFVPVTARAVCSNLMEVNAGVDGQDLAQRLARWRHRSMSQNATARHRMPTPESGRRHPVMVPLSS
jgi:hypothetical protein